MVSFPILPHYKFSLFPYISRRITAEKIKLFGWTVCGLVTAIFMFVGSAYLFGFMPFSQQNSHTDSLQFLESPLAHGSVLGENRSNSSFETITAYAYWKSILLNKPDYREAYIYTATLALTLGNIAEARVFIERALLLDPNNKRAETLREFVENKTGGSGK